MKNSRVLISGASIAGPALAFWLHRYGFEVTVVEKAWEVRNGGQAVDFKGPTHRAVLQKMASVTPGAFSGGEINIPRGDLARILYDLTSDSCDYVFGDSIISLTETGSGVDVAFAQGAPRTFDIVIGADGIHANVRTLAFGPESNYVRHLGYYYVLADLDASTRRRSR